MKQVLISLMNISKFYQQISKEMLRMLWGLSIATLSGPFAFMTFLTRTKVTNSHVWSWSVNWVTMWFRTISMERMMKLDLELSNQSVKFMLLMWLRSIIHISVNAMMDKISSKTTILLRISKFSISKKMIFYFQIQTWFSILMKKMTFS